MLFLKKNERRLKSFSFPLFGQIEAQSALRFHSTIPEYETTPLINLEKLAESLGVSNIWIKDESQRFGLKAFKVLGASYAVAKYFNKYFGANEGNITFSLFDNPEIRKHLKNFTLATATDGNHGRGVAWMAQRLGCKCSVYMPKDTTQSRFENIKSHGADVKIINGSYDEAVTLAKENSEKYGWLLIQDTSWDGYDKIPLWITQGYMTLMEEIFSQLKNEKPTHIFVQCGVGSLPAAISAYCAEKFKDTKPLFTVVEPLDAACVYESAMENKIVSLQNEMKTIMAGLACGTPSLIAWDILKSSADYFLKCSDELTIKGMQILGRGEFGDTKIISGESGAVTTGLIYYLLANSKNKKLAEQLKINKNSKILLISTEGDTDPIMYKKIVGDI